MDDGLDIFDVVDDCFKSGRDDVTSFLSTITGDADMESQRVCDDDADKELEQLDNDEDVSFFGKFSGCGGACQLLAVELNVVSSCVRLRKL